MRVAISKGIWHRSCTLVFIIPLQLLLLVAISSDAANTTLQWFFTNPCGPGFVPLLLSPYRPPRPLAHAGGDGSGKLSTACALTCGEDEQCTGFTIHPCQHYAHAQGCVRGQNGSSNQTLVKVPGSTPLAPLSCPPGFELSRVTQSCYLYQDITRSVTYPQVQDMCQGAGAGAHLVAINDAAEFSFLKAYLAAHGACVVAWTGGIADVSGDNSAWSWNLAHNFTIPVTYFDWCNGEPNNYRGVSEDIIVLKMNSEYEYYDVYYDFVAAGSFSYTNAMCFVCEISPLFY